MTGLSAAGLAQTGNVLKEAGNRLVGIPDAALSLAGSRRLKKLRLRVCILRDEGGTPVAVSADLEPTFAETRRVLGLYGIEVVAAEEPLVRTLEDPAPPEALDSPCANGWWQADLGSGGTYFRRHQARTDRGTATGSAAPITAFVVRDVVGKAGCSLGPLTDYVTVDLEALRGPTLRVLVHEVGHACGLPHSRRPGNLMLPRAMGDHLDPWQIAVLRASRHVTWA